MIKRLLIGLTALVAVAAPVALTASPASASPRSEAIGSAQDYLRYSAFSKAGLIDQLSSPYGEGFPRAVATYAVNHIRVNWNAQAVKSAKSYLRYSHFSCTGLIEQLESPYGEKFTHAQAVYGANQTTAC